VTMKKTSNYRLPPGIDDLVDDLSVSKTGIVGDVAPSDMFNCTLGTDPVMRIEIKSNMCYRESFPRLTAFFRALGWMDARTPYGESRSLMGGLLDIAERLVLLDESCVLCAALCVLAAAEETLFAHHEARRQRVHGRRTDVPQSHDGHEPAPNLRDGCEFEDSAGEWQCDVRAPYVRSGIAIATRRRDDSDEHGSNTHPSQGYAYLSRPSPNPPARWN
jgi:hypothetical protein